MRAGDREHGHQGRMNGCAAPRGGRTGARAPRAEAHGYLPAPLRGGGDCGLDAMALMNVAADPAERRRGGFSALSLRGPRA